MKARLLLLASRINALSLRERGMVFAALAAAIVFLLYSLYLNPLLARRAALRAQLSQQQDNIGGIDNEINQRLAAFERAPDAAASARLAGLAADTARLTASLRAMQKGLVAPEHMSALLETMLKANGRLQMVSMKTLPAVPFGAVMAAFKARPAQPDVAGAGAAVLPAAAAAPLELLYRHGVELTMRGNYLDMVNYMDALEAMPTQLFWGRAQLDVEEYPHARLTLTFYTLSLDKNWMKL